MKFSEDLICSARGFNHTQRERERERESLPPRGVLRESLPQKRGCLRARILDRQSRYTQAFERMRIARSSVSRKAVGGCRSMR